MIFLNKFRVSVVGKVKVWQKIWTFGVTFTLPTTLIPKMIKNIKVVCFYQYYTLIRSKTIFGDPKCPTSQNPSLLVKLMKIWKFWKSHFFHFHQLYKFWWISRRRALGITKNSFWVYYGGNVDKNKLLWYFWINFVSGL